MKERKWDNPRQVLLDVITIENICSSLKPVFYNEQSYIVHEGDPIVAIFLITEGTVWSSSSTSRNIIGEGTSATSRQVERLVKGQLFGEELLDWFWKKDSSIDMSKLILPVSSKTLKTHTKVEAFALMADDFKEIVSRRHDLDNNQVES
uniref:Cyclic nucleotide-binding domain-containing protein n=1 Tax=Fagus sylvatica TaxID=28930 RepID=A0A2N9HJZ7_FAGSY